MPALTGNIESESLVLVALEQGQVRSHKVFTDDPLRLDDQGTRSFLSDLSRSVEAGLVAIAYVKDSQAALSGLDSLQTLAEEFDVHVLDLLHVFEDRWRSILCQDEQCCPVDGNPISPDPDQDSQALIPASMEVGMLLCEQELPENDQKHRDEAFAVLPKWPAGAPSELLDWRDKVVTEVLAHLDSEEFDGWTALANVCVALEDIRVRDGVLRRILERRDVRLGILTNLQKFYALAPSQYRAPIATVFAGTSWLEGDESMTRHAIDVALQNDSDYSLARLLDTALMHGIPHRVWVDSLTAVDYDKCLAGAA